jgi:hypothetical protein
MQGETGSDDAGTNASAWLTLAEAAAALGVSVDTVRRRLKRGQLVGERRPTRQGFAWMIRPDAERPAPSDGMPGSMTPGDGQPSSQAPSSQAPNAGRCDSAPSAETIRGGRVRSGPGRPTQPHDAEAWAALVRELQTELVWRSEAAAMWQGRAELLASELERARDQVRALQAPTETGPPRSVPWWRRWWPGSTAKREDG